MEGAQPADETLAAPGLRTDAGVTPGGGPEVAGTAEEAQVQPGQHDSSRAAAKGKAAKLPGRKATAGAAGTTGKAAKASEQWCSTTVHCTVGTHALGCSGPEVTLRSQQFVGSTTAAMSCTGHVMA